MSIRKKGFRGTGLNPVPFRAANLFVLAVLLGCGPGPETPHIPVNVGSLYDHVNFLTSLPAARNYENLTSLDLAADYIDSVFRIATSHVQTQTFPVEGERYRNIVWTFHPEGRPVVVVGAHYDVAGDQPGADDNASGVAALLELARLLSTLRPRLDHRIDLVAYSLEEPPYFRTEFMGSAVHARSLNEEGIRVEAMIALDMIGYFDSTPRKIRLPLGLTYPLSRDFIAVVGRLTDLRTVSRIKKWIRKGSDIEVRQLSLPPSWVKGVSWSDHRNYWAYGYPAVLITDTSFYRNPHYHKNTDTIRTLDFARMAEVVKGLYWTAVNL
ncbi:MAG: M28 family peptidase [Thermodesulfobacteriota bacterium]